MQLTRRSQDRYTAIDPRARPAPTEHTPRDTIFHHLQIQHGRDPRHTAPQRTATRTNIERENTRTLRAAKERERRPVSVGTRRHTHTHTASQDKSTHGAPGTTPCARRGLAAAPRAQGTRTARPPTYNRRKLNVQLRCALAAISCPPMPRARRAPRPRPPHHAHTHAHAHAHAPPSPPATPRTRAHAGRLLY